MAVSVSHKKSTLSPLLFQDRILSIESALKFAIRDGIEDPIGMRRETQGLPEWISYQGRKELMMRCLINKCNKS